MGLVGERGGDEYETSIDEDAAREEGDGEGGA